MRRVVDLAREGVLGGLADVREVGKDVLVRVGDAKRSRPHRAEHRLNVAHRRPALHDA